MTERRAISLVQPDARALRALAHPQRLRMLGMLRVNGPATATSLAARLGLNTGATSYHLRQLAKHGFIEEDVGRGNARDRWWRARHELTSFPPTDENEEALDAGIAFAQAALSAQITQMKTALARHGELPREWRLASTVSDYCIPLTAAQTEALVKRLHAVLDEAMEMAPKLGGSYEPDAQPVTFILHAFPHPLED